MTGTNPMWAKVERRLARVFNSKKTTLDNESGLVSFTFDDVPQSACHIGSRILEEHGFVGTYYVCGGFTDQGCHQERFHSRDDLIALVERGHEVGSHGYGHLDYQSVSLGEVEADIEKNRGFFLELGWAQPPRNFAYPYGCVSPAVKALCGDRFLSSRGILGGVNGDPCDLALLKAVPLFEERQSEESLARLIEQTARSKGWLVFFTHSVVSDPGRFDCTPELLESAVRRAAESGCRISTVGSVLAAGS